VANEPHARYLLDASALLALLRGEPGADCVLSIVDNAIIHSVQIAESIRKLCEIGVPAKEARESIDELGLPIIETLTAGQAYRPQQFRNGLSLGDSICLSIADDLNVRAVVTADRAWRAHSSIGPDLLLIR